MKNNKGFSLVELIVVIAIMAILAAIAVVGFSAYIQKARNASDAEYISNVAYFAELLATEKQVAVDGIHLPKDKVDGVDDIKLWVKNPLTGNLELKDYRDLPWIQDIYDGVGNWEFIGDLEFNDQGDIGGNTPGDDEENPGEDVDCQHTDTIEEEAPEATCQRTGWKVVRCANSNCNHVIEKTEIPIQNHAYEPLNSVQIEGFTILKCKWCNDKLIKNENNLPLVPIG